MLTFILLETPSHSNNIMHKGYLVPEHDQKPKQRLVRMALWEVIMILFFTSPKNVRISYVTFLHSALPILDDPVGQSVSDTGRPGQK
jgi:hypothetical protein